MASAKAMQETQERAEQYNRAADRLDMAVNSVMMFVAKETAYHHLSNPGWQFDVLDLDNVLKAEYFSLITRRNNAQRSLDESRHELSQALYKVSAGV